MSDTTPVLTEKCRYEGKRYGLVYSDTIQNVVSGVTGMCGVRGFLCDECKQDRWDKRIAPIYDRLDTLMEMLLDVRLKDANDGPDPFVEAGGKP